MYPVTPPRASSSQKARVPYTPTTPFFKSGGASPQKVSKPQLSPVKYSRTSHLTTPNPTPRNRKKNNVASGSLLLDDGFTFHSSTRTLFPPTPSTVGSGRTKDHSNVFKSPLKHRVEESPSGHQGMMGVMASPEEPIVAAKRKLMFSMESDEDEDEDDDVDTTIVEDNIINTPQGKIISRELAQKWVEHIPEEDVQDDERFITASKASNPFLSNDNDMKEFVLRKPSRPLEFVEFVNKKGEKIMKPAGTLDTSDDDDHFISRHEKKTYRAKKLFGELTKEKSPSFEVYHDER